MFTDISWATYLTLLGIAALTWYMALGCIHYYSDIKNFLNAKKNSHFETFYGSSETSASASSDTMDNLTAKGTFDAPALQDFDTIEELVERVKAAIGEAAQQEDPKAYFLSHLVHLLKEYPSLVKSQFRPSVSEFIYSECELQGLVQGLEKITMEDIEALWPA